MTTAIYWFRSDLRLRDSAALIEACKRVDFLLPVYIHPPHLEGATSWGFLRTSKQRKVFLQESLRDLRNQLRALRSELLEISGDPLEIFQDLQAQFDVNQIYCECIEAPEELNQVASLSKAGFEVQTHWQSSMLDPQSLPFKLENMPDIFTQFRQQVEKTRLKFTDPVDAPLDIPPLPGSIDLFSEFVADDVSNGNKLFPGGESAALAHIEQYFNRRLPDSYKQTRNQLIGMDYSSKFSPWLALGCCSARSIAKKLSEYELQYGANEGTYWLWFELLWRDYFRFLHFKYGGKLYRSSGLCFISSNPFNDAKFKQWISGNTGQSLIDAGMRELSTSGYLSNRMRQIVASFWIYDMKGDWQAGAAWFESQLIDYEVYSNKGNWLYIAGKGTDPRGGRQFSVAKQIQDHDLNGLYRQLWLN